MQGVQEYLDYSDQRGFENEMYEYWEGKGDPLCLVSLFAKLCYKSLTEGKNANITKVRSIESNLRGVIESGHGSVFEHVFLNFVVTDCSRVFTHELVRHRVGTAFSQTSGRYVAIDVIDLVLPPELDQYTVPCDACVMRGGECSKCQGMRVVTVAEDMAHFSGFLAAKCGIWRDALIKEGDSFAHKKKMTSAIRRMAPNGQTNEIGFSVNVRSLRNVIQMRTNRHAEWEIRLVFNQIAQIVLDKWPMMLEGGQRHEWEGLYEWVGLEI